MGKPNWWVLGPFTVIALVGAVLALTYSGNGGTTTSPLEARHRCEDFVDAELKSPSSADYDLAAVERGAGWVVTGTVDSENSFGASLRSAVRCELHFTNAGVVLDSLAVG